MKSALRQRRRLEQAARADVMLPVIDEGSGRNMAGGAAQARIMRERLCEQRFAAAFGVADPADQPPGRTKTRIRQEIDVLDVGDDGVENGGRRLGSGELVDDDVADEVAQRRHPAVGAIGREIARAAQARNPDRIEHAVVRLRIEQRTRGVEISRPCRHLRNEELGVAGAVDMAGFAADAGLLRDIAEDRWRLRKPDCQA